MANLFADVVGHTLIAAWPDQDSGSLVLYFQAPTPAGDVTAVFPGSGNTEDVFLPDVGTMGVTDALWVWHCENAP